MADEQAPYPPPDAVHRAVLVRNISPAATAPAIEDFFSFCGPIESHKLRPVRPAAGPHTQEAVVVFADARAREDALVMDKSSIVDRPVSITPIPHAFDFHAPDPAPQPAGFLAGGFSAFGDLFAGVGTAVAAEMDKAGKMLDSATDTGVLKAAKDQVALATQKSREFVTDIDDKWKVRDNIATAAESSRKQVTQVASVVATQTANVAQQVDSSLHISENTGKLAEKARENQTVNNGIMAVTGGFQQLLAQTGLRQNATDSSPSLAPGAEPNSQQQAPPTSKAQ